jgi:hypothetical protein
MRRQLRLFPLLMICFALALTACGSASSSMGGGNNGGGGGPTAPSISVQPADATVTAGEAATFSIMATGTSPLSYQWRKNMSNISGATSATYTTPSTVSADNGSKFDVVVSNVQGNTTSSQATLMVTATTASSADVVTHHYDIARSGANTQETILTTTSVSSTSFGKVAEFPVDGQIDGQILYLSQVQIAGQGNKNVVYFATENESVYALDADTLSGSSATVLWKTTVHPSGEIPLVPSDAGCGYINPVGVISTPVIDRGRNAIYVMAASKSGSNVHHYMYALNLATGGELFGGPTLLAATFPGSKGNAANGTVTFLDKVQQNRAALLESGGLIYTAWSGYNGDCGNYSAWVVAFSADSLAQVSAIDLVPNSNLAGIWMGGGGPAADSAGNVYLATGNAGGGNTPGTSNNYGDSFVKLGSGTPLNVADYFAPSIAIADDANDADLGSAGPLLLPDLVDAGGVMRHLAIVSGKDGAIYIASRDNMGQYNAMGDNIYQELPHAGRNFSSPAYFNGRVYIGPAGSALRAYSVSQAKLGGSPSSQSAHTFGGVGTVPSVSANGNANGIVWALDGGTKTLYAFDAQDLTRLLYSSAQAASGRDNFASVGGHFITPMVANGRVYFGTGSTLAVFGLLH